MVLTSETVAHRMADAIFKKIILKEMREEKKLMKQYSENVTDNISSNEYDSFRENLSQKFIEDTKICSSKKPMSSVTLEDIEKHACRYEDFAHRDNFEIVSEVKLDMSSSRQTLIRFVPMNIDKWNACGNWVYMFVVNDRIVKIGGTKNGLKKRAASYLCGHHTRKYNTCSITNGIIYNTFLYYLQKGAKILMYGMRCPPVYATIDVFGEQHSVETQVFDVYESVLIRKYTSEIGMPPLLSTRSDPRFS